MPRALVAIEGAVAEVLALPTAAKKFSFSVRPIAKSDNGAGGSLLLSLYAKNRIIDGMDDALIVKIVS
ncbi:hypothetical protein AB0D49_33330 [Streptomyces sp. NPDC048290]|uniref:hypothetical protein n=1 Tax=Streptomyces sp. NPDC048290 TaxID=3155811 RepID=UPI003414C666